MTGYLISIPTLIIAAMVQTVVLGRVQLVNGKADLVLLVIIAWSLNQRVRSAFFWAILGGLIIGFISATPFYLPILIYLSITVGLRLFIRQVWQAPLLAMFAATIIGTLLQHMVFFITTRTTGASFTLLESLNLVTLPSLLLNLLLSLPVYALVLDMASRLYPVESEI